jgi:hypothetical protein
MYRIAAAKIHSIAHHALFHVVSLLRCSYFKSKIPRQGWMYLSVNNLCFHAYFFGNETKIVIRWADVIELERSNSILFPDSIRVRTRDKTEVHKYYTFQRLNRSASISRKSWLLFLLQYYFSVFIRKQELFNLMQQLTNLTMKQ